MVALIDFDSVIYNAVYRCVSFAQIRQALTLYSKEEAREWLNAEVYFQGVNRCENELLKMQSYLQSIFLEKITSYELYITTCTNSFRVALDPEYKAKRKKNNYVWSIREHYKFNDAFYSDTHEADDLIASRSIELGQDNCIVVSLDKDLKQIGGWLWSYQKETEVTEKGEPILNEYGSKNRVFKYKSVDWISKEQADLFFWKQMLMGDSVDGIKGITAISKEKKAEIKETYNVNVDCRVGEVTAGKIISNAKNLFITVARQYIIRGQKNEFYKMYQLLKLG